MTKKILIIILILLIFVSLSVIGYIIISQNPNFKLANLWPASSVTSNQTPQVPSNFFPQATNTSYAVSGNQNSNQSVNVINPTSTDNLTSNNPNLAGTSAIGLTLLNSKTERVMFVDRASGNIYEIDNQNNPIRLTFNTVENIGEVYWGQDKAGERVILRQEDNGQIINSVNLVKTSVGTSTTLNSLTGQTLSPNIKAFAISPDGSKFFTLEPSGTGVAGYINDWSGKNKKKVWSFAFGDWQVSWPKANLISLQSKASANSSGYLYFLNPDTGSFTKILKGLNGLIAKVSPDGKKLIFAQSGLGKFSLYLYDVATQKTSSPGINTLPEKCVWASNDSFYCAVPRSIPTNQYPDSWYQGKVIFTDDLWQINTTKETTIIISTLKSGYDLINLTVAPTRGWIYAINKKDNSIQAFSLKSE
jgi:hypothetical protein